jgi:hypothetical protein
MTRLLTTLTLLVLSVPALAQDLSITLGHYSVHLVSEDTTNSEHALIGVRYHHAFGATFINSYGRRTYAVGYTDSVPFTVNSELYGIVGVTHGYRQCYGDNGDSAKVCPLGAGGWRYTANEHLQPGVLVAGDAVLGTLDIAF